MAFQQPTIETILDRIKGDIRTGLDLKAVLRRTFLFSFATAMAGLSHELHGRASYISRQLFVDQMEAGFLTRYGAIYGMPKIEATFAQLEILFTGLAGAVIPIATELNRTDGQTYQTNAEVTIPSAVIGIATVFDCTTVADLSYSLQSSYFEFATPGANYYVWLSVDGLGVDPSLSGKTGVEVSILENDLDTAVAAAVQTAINGLTDVNASVLGNIVTITNVDTGSTDDPTDGTMPTGFVLSVTTVGVDAVIGDQVVAVVTADNAGFLPNTDNGESLSLTGAIVGVDSDSTVTATIIEGEDIETDDNYRARILDRLREPPHGGNVHDYVTWAKEVAGVTRAWVFDGPMGAGTVGVAFVEDTEVDIFPSQAKIDEVQAYINDRAPVTARVYVYPPVKVELDLTIKIKPNTATVRDNVTLELRDLIYRDANPNGAINDPSLGTTYDGTILISKINEAISIATGEQDHFVVTPTTNVTNTNGEMFALGTITWQALA